MSNMIKSKEGSEVTKEELEQIRSIATEYENITFELGNVAIKKALLEDQHNILLNQYAEVQQKESDLIDKIKEKYGEGDLDLSTGKFVPHKEK